MSFSVQDIVNRLRKSHRIPSLKVIQKLEIISKISSRICWRATGIVYRWSFTLSVIWSFPENLPLETRVDTAKWACPMVWTIRAGQKALRIRLITEIIWCASNGLGSLCKEKRHLRHLQWPSVPDCTYVCQINYYLAIMIFMQIYMLKALSCK